MEHFLLDGRFFYGKQRDFLAVSLHEHEILIQLVHLHSTLRILNRAKRHLIQRFFLLGTLCQKLRSGIHDLLLEHHIVLIYFLWQLLPRIHHFDATIRLDSHTTEHVVRHANFFRKIFYNNYTRQQKKEDMVFVFRFIILKIFFGFFLKIL